MKFRTKQFARGDFGHLQFSFGRRRKKLFKTFESVAQFLHVAKSENRTLRTMLSFTLSFGRFLSNKGRAGSALLPTKPNWINTFQLIESKEQKKEGNRITSRPVGPLGPLKLLAANLRSAMSQTHVQGRTRAQVGGQYWKLHNLDRQAPTDGNGSGISAIHYSATKRAAGSSDLVSR